MAKLVKIVLAVLGTLVLLSIAIAIALPLLFDPNDYRQQLAAKVKQQTGRDFSVGNIRLAVFPWLRVELSEVTLGNAEGFAAAPMLTVKRAELGARLLPLLREHRLEASTVTLEGAKLDLAIAKDGRSNWQDLLNKPATTTAEPQAGEPLSEKLQRLDIEGIKLDGVEVSYDDQQAGKQIRLKSLQLKTSRLRAGKPFDIGGTFMLIASAPALTAAIDFDTTVAVDTTTGNVALAKPRLKLDAQLAAGEPVSAAVTLKAESLVYDHSGQLLSSDKPLTLAIERLLIGAAEAPKLTAKGTLIASWLAKLGSQQHTLTGLDAALELGGSRLPQGKPESVKLSGTLVADLAAQELKIGGLRLSTLGLDITARQWLLSHLDGTPQLDGDLGVATFDPRRLMTLLGIGAPPTADASTLKSASFNGMVSASARGISLGRLQAKLDDTALQGELAVTDLATTAITFALKADRLDADRYLAPAPKPGASVGASATPAAKAEANNKPLPIDAIDKLNAQGTLDVASMKLKNLKLANVRLKLDGGANATHRQQLSASLYGGTAALNASVAPGARLAVRLVLENISAAPLLKDFIDSDKLSGRGSVTLDVTSAGRTLAAVKRALDGKLDFHFTDGAVKGFNLGKFIREGQALLAQQVPVQGAAQATDFAELRGSGVIANGVLKSSDLTAKNPLLRLEGEGEINLVDETIDYLARPTLVNTASGQGGKERIDLSGLVVPIRIHGDLYRPKVSVDWQSALKQKAVEQLREKLGVSEATVREQREALKARAKQELSKGLLKLFGGNKTAPEQTPPPTPPPAP